MIVEELNKLSVDAQVREKDMQTVFTKLMPLALVIGMLFTYFDISGPCRLHERPSTHCLASFRC